MNTSSRYAYPESSHWDQLPFDTATQADLARRCRDGDKEAIAECLGRCWRALCHAALRASAGRLSNDEAISLAVQGALHALQRGYFDSSRGNLIAYVCSWASGYVLREIRRTLQSRVSYVGDIRSWVDTRQVPISPAWGRIDWRLIAPILQQHLTGEEWSVLEQIALGEQTGVAARRRGVSRQAEQQRRARVLKKVRRLLHETPRV